MTTEEKHEYNTWLVLSALREKQLTVGNTFSFPTDYVDDLNPELTHGIIRLLHEQGYLLRLDFPSELNIPINGDRIMVPRIDWPDNLARRIQVELIPKKFNRIYQTLTKKFAIKSAVEPRSGTPMLSFAQVDGIASFKTGWYTFKPGTKAHTILEFLQSNKGWPQGTNDIIEGCNKKIATGNYKFRAEKDIRDTLNNIRKNLKVNKGEFFPIIKQGDKWVWKE